MNFFHILSEIEKTDPEVFERFDSRRKVFQHLTGFGKKITAASLPLAISAIMNKAYGQSTGAPSVVDVLTFALKLEYLEAIFYNLALSGDGSVGNNTTTAAQTTFRNQFSGTNLSSLLKIRTDENNHVNYLRTAITQAGGTPIVAPAVSQFDFTGGKGSNTGPFAGVFTSPAIFLAVAQSLEDTGVRAYKGGAPYLASNKDVLTAALNIHSVEARHASRLRTMRRGGFANNAASATVGAGTGASPKSWISETDGGGAQPAQTAPIYGAGTAPTYTPAGITFPAEDNKTQGATGSQPGVNLQTALASLNFPAAAFSEAFDEALPVPTVLTIASTFTITGSTFFS